MNPREPFVLCDKYTKLQVKKEDGTTVATITTDDWDMADGYTIVGGIRVFSVTVLLRNLTISFVENKFRPLILGYLATELSSI